MFLFNKDLTKPQNIIFIAEIGINHEGNFLKAKKLIKLAKEAGADAVKFQSYTLDRYCAIDELERYKRLKKFQLNEKQFYNLYKYSKKIGMNFLSTALTEDYVKKLAKYCEVIKVASGDMDFFPVIKEILNAKVKTIISTGAHNLKDIKKLVSYIKRNSGNKYLDSNVALLQCTSSYPTNLSDVNINVVNTLKKEFRITIGYSNHIADSSACLAAVANGAKIIEVHFTDKRKGKKFHDHFISFEPKELKSLIEISKKILITLGSKNKKILYCEKKFVKNGKKGLVAARDLKKGKTLLMNDIMYARHARYFSYEKKKTLISKTINRNLKKGQLFKKEFFY